MSDHPHELPQVNASLELPTLRGRFVGASNRQFWRSLDEAAATPEFEEYLHREFPSQLAEWNDPEGRRGFLKLMAASLALAGVAGCTRQPQEKIVPYVRAPEELVPGRPQFYATAMVRAGYALGLLVESHMGRPTKVEGNPEHPASLGATDALAQASVLTMYDPDRSQTIVRRGVIETWDTFITAMSREMEPVRARRGAGLRILTETITSPTLAAQLQALLGDLPEARWYEYEPAGDRNLHAGARQAFGRDVDVTYNFRQAKVVVSLDSNFFVELPGSVRYAREFIDARRVSVDASSMNRLFVAESTPTITGAMADHRVAVRPSQIETLARDLLAEVRGGAGQGGAVNGVATAWVAAVGKDLRANHGASIVIAGPGQPPAVHALVHAINAAIGSRGQTVNYLEPIAVHPGQERASLSDLADEMRAGSVDTLLMLGSNPVYSAPGEVEFAEALAKVRLRVHLGLYNDETAFLSDWHIPAAHFLEAWGDARAFDGTATIQQPLIAPLYEGKTAHELLAVIAGSAGQSAFEIVQQHWQTQLGENDFARQWRKAIHDGLVAETEAQTVDAQLSEDLRADDATAARASTELPEGKFEVEIRPDPTIGDGRYANNGWLQELPKPMTKLTWDNVAYVSLNTADELKLKSGDLIDVMVADRSVRAPVWVMPGQPDRCISLTLGYGRTRTGRVGTGIGYNAFALLPAQGAWFTQATIRLTGETYKLATTQSHYAMEGRDIVRVTTIDKLRDDSKHLWDAKHHVEGMPSLYPEFDYSKGNQWGMVIDQTACIGCNACVVACQSENNIPVIGKEQVANGREMHWLRIDRYHVGEPESPDLETYFQPMLCVHCEKAPCEVVCPVAATAHDSEGTNNMIYNRCVGTRYCSNNCPYKVRRFNYLQYSDETTPSLKLMRNPDVTVRSRGVMEKCTYCIQRISVARIDAKVSGDGFVPDGDVVTACQQACPTRAIIFGNLNDKQGETLKLKSSPLNYGVLAELGTQPRTTYLARVINPHEDLPRAVTPKNHPDQDKAHS
jgi:MoCo/4Fe-4S cofactor protein with predicted Tat translocation signal